MERSWVRLERVIKWTDLSIQDFAMGIGMKRSESLYRIIRNKENLIPFYDQTKSEPSFSLLIPIFDADKAKKMTDRAMEPIIPAFAITVLKKTDNESIIYGKIYHIQTDKFTVVRIIRKNKLSDNELILEAANKEYYDDIIIPKDEIINIYSVCGVISSLT